MVLVSLNSCAHPMVLFSLNVDTKIYRDQEAPTETVRAAM